MKKLISIMLIIVALFLVASCDNNPNEKDNVKDNTPGEGVDNPSGGEEPENPEKKNVIVLSSERSLADALREMDLEEAEELVIEGTIGDDDYSSLSGMVTLKRLDIESVTNEEIPKGAFARSYFETIKLPKKLKTIGNYAFAESSLLDVDIPLGVTKLGEGVFFKATSLERLHIPQSVEFIGSWFVQQYDYEEDTMPKSASYLTVVLEEGIKELAPAAFCGAKIKEIVIPKTITEIPDFCFAQTHIDKIVLHDKIKRIGNAAFENSFLKLENNTLVLPKELKVLGPRAFSVQNEYSYNVVFNDKLEYVYQKVFETGFVIEEFVFPATLKGFSKSALSTRTGLKRAIFKGATPPEILPHFDYMDIQYNQETNRYSGIISDAIQPQDPKAYRDVEAYVPQSALEAYKSAFISTDNLNPFGEAYIKTIESMTK